MGKETEFFDNLTAYIKQSIHTTAPARVLEYYPAAHRADLKILYLSTDGEYLYDEAIVENAPVLKHVVPDIKKGSTVFVSFAERSIANMAGNSEFDPDSSDTHDINDAVVIGVFEG